MRVGDNMEKMIDPITIAEEFAKQGLIPEECKEEFTEALVRETRREVRRFAGDLAGTVAGAVRTNSLLQGIAA